MNVRSTDDQIVAIVKERKVGERAAAACSDVSALTRGDIANCELYV